MERIDEKNHVDHVVIPMWNTEEILGVKECHEQRNDRVRDVDQNVERGEGQQLQGEFSPPFPIFRSLPTNSAHRVDHSNDQNEIGDDKYRDRSDSMKKPIDVVKDRIVHIANDGTIARRRIEVRRAGIDVNGTEAEKWRINHTKRQGNVAA